MAAKKCIVHVGVAASLNCATVAAAATGNATEPALSASTPLVMTAEAEIAAVIGFSCTVLFAAIVGVWVALWRLQRNPDDAEASVASYTALDAV